MFNSGSVFRKEIIILSLLGIGLYSKSNDINLANNTAILLLLFMIFSGQEQIEQIKQEIGVNEAIERRRIARYASQFC